MTNEISVGGFDNLDPSLMISSVEEALGIEMTGFASPLPSYINRVYEVETADKTRLIAKFYRPGRWTPEALRDEHDFILDCAAEDIPVVPPMLLRNQSTIDEVDGIKFAVFQKRAGRNLETNFDDDWRRLGSIIARIHLVGDTRDAPSRIRLSPETATKEELALLIDGGFVTSRQIPAFKDVTDKIFDLIAPLFDGVEFIRIHGDCHRGNLLERPGEGIMVIDFDDMVIGPPVQDLWLFLPDHAPRARREIDMILDGYEQFREFDYPSLRLIEALRAMRIIYFLAWCARQVDDYKFQHNFPDWGGDAFWRKEIDDLNYQYQVMLEDESISGVRQNTSYPGRILTDH